MGGGLDKRQGASGQRSAAGAAPDLGPGKRTLTEQLGPGAAPVRTPAVAERGLNAVITVVVRGPDGEVLARWRARGHWDGPLPVRYHGARAAFGWTWSDRAARDTRIPES
jgi:hypothetical protein